MNPEYASIEVGLDEDGPYPCVVALSDGSQPMTDPQLGWIGNRIPRWNGFVAFPLFDRPTVERIAANLAKSHATNPDDSYLTWDGDTVVLHDGVAEQDAVTDPEGWGDYEPERIEPQVVEGVQRWDIGGCSWVWSEWTE